MSSATGHITVVGDARELDDLLVRWNLKGLLNFFIWRIPCTSRYFDQQFSISSENVSVNRRVRIADEIAEMGTRIDEPSFSLFKRLADRLLATS